MAGTTRDCVVAAAAAVVDAVVDDVAVVEAETVCVSVWSPRSVTTGSLPPGGWQLLQIYTFVHILVLHCMEN